jgi:cytochrome c-type biogenesis protein CcmH/NrfF
MSNPALPSRIFRFHALRSRTLLSRAFRSRALQCVVLCLAIVTMLGAGDPGARFDKIGHNLMCACGCGQILLECNHVGCPDSARMITELNNQIGQGGTDDAVMNWFAGKYGATILAAPIRGGFDNVAWITPIAVFLFATLGTAVLVRVWKRRTDRLHPVAARTNLAVQTSNSEALRERIRKETQY